MPAAAPAAPPKPATPPAAAPAPAPAAAPAPAPAPAPEPGGGAPEADPFKEFNDAIKLVDAQKDPKATPAPKPAAAPAAPAKPSEPPKPAAAGKPLPRELRDELERNKTELQAAKTAHAELEKKLVAAEAAGKNTEALTKRLEALQKDMDTLRAENRTLKFQGSDEWAKTYEKPFNDAAAYAERIITKLDVLDEAGDPVRKTDWQKDFGRLYGRYQEDPGGAIREANTMFGDAAHKVISTIEDLSRRQHEMNQALEVEKKNWKENAQAEEGKRAEFQERIKQAEEKVGGELAESVAEYHDEDPSDTEAANQRAKGYALFDADPKTWNEAVRKRMHVRHMVAAFGVQKLKILRLNKEVADLKAENEALKKGKQPPRAGGKPAGDNTGTAPEKSFEDELREESRNWTE